MRLLTAQEVANILSVHLTTIGRWTRLGKLKSVKFDRAIRYRNEDVEDFINSNIKTKDNNESECQDKSGE